MMNLNEMKSKELKEMARDLGVKNWWTMNKASLIAAIEEMQSVSEEAIEEVVEETHIEEAAVEAEVVVKVEDQKEEKKQTVTSAPKRGALIEYDGRSQNICAWAKELGISANTLYGRIYKLGWTVEKAFTVKR